jgi:anti-sigma regulatory factor (Ser/Thr protein kinase)
MHVVEIPRYLDDKGVDAVAAELGTWPPDQRVLFDARLTRWASPFGFTALLSAGQALRDAGAETPRLTVPESEEVRRYWAKAGFFRHAEALFELHGKVPRRAAVASDVLLPVTSVRASQDVHEVVGRIQQGAARILTADLHLEPSTTIRFSMALSEVCQNVVEHARSGGWVAVHAYTWRKRIGRRVAVIAVSDSGVGFRGSLEATAARKYGDRWSDRTALEEALWLGGSRFPDPGRGQGLAAIKRFVGQHTGKITIRSGTARIAIVPTWDDDPAEEDRLPYFPGAQVQIVIPAKEPPPP